MDVFVGCSDSQEGANYNMGCWNQQVDHASGVVKAITNIDFLHQISLMLSYTLTVYDYAYKCKC